MGTQHHPTRDYAAWLVANIIFSCAFIITINILFMNIIFGTIISVFGKLRNEKLAAEQTKMNVCYICSVSRRQFTKVAASHAFDQHKHSRHNVLAYVRFIFYIRSKNRNHLTGAEHYVLQHLDGLNSGWFPKSRHVLSDAHLPSK